MSYHYLFGPVQSRRLGSSLGIDLTPNRECSFNCLYCECGRTALLTTERKEYVPTAEVIAELRSYLSTGPDLDSVTFAGSGEPTLHVGLGRIIAMLKEEFPSYRVTVITNSSLLPDARVRQELLGADLIIPSLDAVTDPVFRRLNRPRMEVSIDAIIEGLRLLRQEYSGELWLEIFILPGINDGQEDVTALRSTLDDLDIQRIQLNTLDRPGAVADIAPAPRQHLEEIAAMLGRPADIVASRRLLGDKDLMTPDLLHLLHQTLSLRALRIEDLCSELHLSRVDVAHALDILITRHLILPLRDEHGLLYQATQASGSPESP